MTSTPPAPSTPRGRGAFAGPGLTGLIAVALVSLNLRPGASSLGPVLPEVTRALGLSSAVAGVMTSLPCLCFSVAGAFAVRLSKRMGVAPGIALGVLATVAGLGLRVFVDDGALFIALSTLALAGMALGNILVPAWIKRHTRSGTTAAMAVYSTGLAIGGSLGSLLSAPLEPAVPGGWRGSLGIWSLVAALALAPWLRLATRERRERVRPADTAPAGTAVRHSRTTLVLALYFGVQSMNAYVQFGWLPAILRDAGISSVEAGALLAVVAGLGIVGGMVMPAVVTRRRVMTGCVLAFGALLLVGYAGLLLAPSAAPWLWAITLGVSGWSFPAAISLITARTRDPHVTAQVSGFVQPVGYLIAAIGPVAVGVIHQLTGGWTAVLILLMLSAVALTVAGLVLARSGYVDDDIVRA